MGHALRAVAAVAHLLLSAATANTPAVSRRCRWRDHGSRGQASSVYCQPQLSLNEQPGES